MDIIDFLFKSEIWKKLLLLFFSQKEKKFYVNELARFIGSTQGTVNRELIKLKNLNLLKREEKGNLVFYFLNKSFFLLPEFEKIIKKTFGIECQLKEIIKKIKGIKFAYIFGSYVDNKLASNSDIDVYLIGDNIDEDKLVFELANLEKKINRTVDYHFAGIKEYKNKLEEDSFIQSVHKKNILLTDNQDEFERFFRKFGKTKVSEKRK
jgi:predicted nucleotidyltransferase